MFTTETESMITENHEINYQTNQEETERPETNSNVKRKEEQRQAITLEFDFSQIIFLLITIVTFILLLYYFYNVMIYFMYFIFCLSALYGLARIFDVLFSKIPFGNCK
jgi:uncharacterized protein YqhQ